MVSLISKQINSGLDEQAIRPVVSINRIKRNIYGVTNSNHYVHLHRSLVGKDRWCDNVTLVNTVVVQPDALTI